MPYEIDPVRGVSNNYGAMNTEGKFGAEIGNSLVKYVVFDVDHTDLASTTPAVYNKFDYVVPAGSVFLGCDIIVETAVVGPTAINVGTYTFVESTRVITAHDLDGLATTAVTTLDAIGDRVKGAGALLATGTGAGYAMTAPVVIRIAPTVAAATAGKFRVVVSYIAPTP